jgi:ketosteroid isomerase-like protein
MSAENVQIVRQLFEAMRTRDNLTPFELYDSDVILTSGSRWMSELGFAPRYRGHDGVRAFWRYWLDAWQKVEFLGDLELIDAGDYVLAFNRVILRGRKSGAEVPLELSHLYELREGRIVHVQLFSERAEALKAAGLSGWRPREDCSSLEKEQYAAPRDTAVMASANVELVRSIYAAWERGEYGSADWAHPEIEYVIADGPTPGSWKGLADMAKGARANLDPWQDFRFQAEEYRELDDERVLVLTCHSGRGKRSGVEIGEVRPRGAGLFTLREGKVIQFVQYMNLDRALADLGLAPDQA